MAQMKTTVITVTKESGNMKKHIPAVILYFFIYIFAYSIYGAVANAKDITWNQTKQHKLTANKKDSQHIVTDFVRAGDSSQMFVLKHGECGGQDCKWGAHRTERQLKQYHWSKKKIGNEVYYALSVYIPKEFGYDYVASKMSLVQAKMKGVDMPIWMINTDGAGYYVMIPHSRGKCMIGILEKEQWYDFVVKVDYGREKVKGHKYFEMWQNGEKFEGCDLHVPIITKNIMKESKSHGWSSNTQQIIMRYGPYKWRIGDYLSFTGKKKPEIKKFNQPNGYTNIQYPFKYDWGKELVTTVMYYDEIRIGKTLNEVMIQDVAVD